MMETEQPMYGPEPASIEYLQHRVKALEMEAQLLAKRETELCKAIMVKNMMLERREREQIQLWNAVCSAPALVKRDHLLALLRGGAGGVIPAAAICCPKPLGTNSNRWEAMAL